MNDALFSDDALFAFERTHLERLRLAAEVLLGLAGGPALPEPLEVDPLQGTRRARPAPARAASWLAGRWW